MGLQGTMDDEVRQAETETSGRIIKTQISGRAFLVSWQEDQTICVEVAAIGSQSRNEMAFRIPVSEKEEYRSVVDRVVRSFQPGDLDAAW